MQTQMLKERVTVDQDHHLHLDIKIPEGFPQQVDVLIVPVQNEEDEFEGSSHELANLQMQSNFVKEVLSDPAEDVWNEYL